jgi:F-type H+-transporting ATPase subunit epsilon
MNLKILLPYRVFVEEAKVSRIVAETSEGSFGFLPHRLDCVASLVPGILVYENSAQQEVYLAVDEGVLVKTGVDVMISIRDAIAGKELSQLRKDVETSFLKQNEEDKTVHIVMAKLESGFIRRLAQFSHD